MATTIEPRQDELDKIYFEIFGKNEEHQAEKPTTGAYPELPDDYLIMRANEAENGRKFKALWNGGISGYNGDESAADQALMNMLAFWTGGRASQMERLFSQSGLGQRAKWRDRADYKERTIKKAISSVREFYEPPKDGQKPTFEDYNPPLDKAAIERIQAETGITICQGGRPALDSIAEEDPEALPVIENPRLTLNLEPDNTIVLYIEYGKTTCDAYPEYHYGYGLELVAIGTNRKLVLRLKQGDVFPNIWKFDLGKSTISRKSAAKSKADRFAKDLFPSIALPQSYSPEGMIEELAEKPRSYLFKDEAGAMLAAMQKNYMLEMRDLYCILYDCQGYSRKLRSGQRKEKREFSFENPFVNIACATTPETFREYTSLLDLTSGWLLRFIFFYPNYRKPWMAFKPAGEEDFTRYAEVLGRLSRVKGMFFDREEPLEITLSPEAWAYYQAWQETRENGLQETANAIELALWGRLSFYALKLAMLFTVGRADYQESTQVSLDHIKEACRQIDEYFLPVGKLVAEEVAREETTNLQNKILGTLSRAGGRILRTDLMKALHVTLKELAEALAALGESEEIETITVKGKGKSSNWIVLKRREKIDKPEVSIENPPNDSKDSNNRNNPNNRTNSEISTGIKEIIATNAIIATDGIIVPDLEKCRDNNNGS